MRQIVLEGPRALEVQEAELPYLLPGQVLVELKAASICGTDLHIYTGETRVDYPRVPGHEAFGTISELGLGVTSLAKGDGVVINPNLDCGNCESCIRGKENLCIKARLLGRETDGVLRQYFTIDERHAFKIPPHVSLEESPIIQPFTTVAHAHYQAGIQVGESVVVLGVGASGLMEVQLARLAGASPLIAVGRSSWKLELARGFGAEHLVNATQGDILAQVLALTNGHGADVVFEAVGIPETVHQAIAMTKPGGRVIGFGISPRPLPELDLYTMYLKEMTLRFPRATTRNHFDRAVALIAANQVDLKPLITREYSLANAPEAFRYEEENQSRVLRLIIKS